MLSMAVKGMKPNTTPKGYSRNNPYWPLTKALAWGNEHKTHKFEYRAVPTLAQILEIVGDVDPTAVKLEVDTYRDYDDCEHFISMFWQTKMSDEQRIKLADQWEETEAARKKAVKAAAAEKKKQERAALLEKVKADPVVLKQLLKEMTDDSK